MVEWSTAFYHTTWEVLVNHPINRLCVHPGGRRWRSIPRSLSTASATPPARDRHNVNRGFSPPTWPWANMSPRLPKIKPLAVTVQNREFSILHHGWFLSLSRVPGGGVRTWCRGNAGFASLGIAADSPATMRVRPPICVCIAGSNASRC